MESFEGLIVDLEKFLLFEEITCETINRFVDRIVVHEDETLEILYKFKVK